MEEFFGKEKFIAARTREHLPVNSLENSKDEMLLLLLEEAEENVMVAGAEKVEASGAGAGGGRGGGIVLIRLKCPMSSSIA